MATKPRHLFLKPNVDMQAWPVDPNTAVTIDAESFVYYDTTAGWILPATDTNGANIVGQMSAQQPVSIYGPAFTGQGSGAIPPNFPDNHAMVNRYGQAFAKATASENYSPGTLVGIGADAQTISTAATNKFAFVSGDQPVVTSATAGQLIKIDFRALYPNVDIR